MKSQLTPNKAPTDLRQFDLLPRSAWTRQPMVEGMFSISAPTVWRWVKQGILPRPRKLGPNTTAWNVGELRDAMERMAKPQGSAKAASKTVAKSFVIPVGVQAHRGTEG